MRHVGPADVRGGPDCREQVLHHGPMQHFLTRDSKEHPTPPLDSFKLILPEPAAWCALQAERGVQVLTHHRVLELRGLGKKVGQLLAVLHNNGSLFPHGEKVSTAMARAQPEGWTIQLGVRCSKTTPGASWFVGLRIRDRLMAKRQPCVEVDLHQRALASAHQWGELLPPAGAAGQRRLTAARCCSPACCSGQPGRRRTAGNAAIHRVKGTLVTSPPAKAVDIVSSWILRSPPGWMARRRMRS
jgi:hypothetical protein